MRVELAAVGAGIGGERRGRDRHGREQRGQKGQRRRRVHAVSPRVGAGGPRCRTLRRRAGHKTLALTAQRRTAATLARLRTRRWRIIRASIRDSARSVAAARQRRRPRRRPRQADALRAAEGAASARRTPAGRRTSSTPRARCRRARSPSWSATAPTPCAKRSRHPTSRSCVQDPPRGTGDAARIALDALPDDGVTLVTIGDIPLVPAEALARARRAGAARATWRC